MELGYEGCRWARFSGLLTGAILFLTAFAVHSQNLVNNGSFEANGGSFSGWTISHPYGETNYPADGPMIGNSGYNSPHYASFLFEPTAGGDLLSQDLSTTPGDLYDISFMAEDGGGHNFGEDFSFGSFTEDLNNSFATGPGQWYRGWMNFNFLLTATQLQTDLSFLVYADQGSEFGLDDISVTAVPRMQALSVGGKFQVTVTNCSSQVVIQASTNLVNWVSVCTNMAPCTFTDSCVMPRCFFRAAVLVQTNGP